MEDKEFFNCLEKSKLLGCRVINLTGGEPLLNKHWRSFISIAHKMGFAVVLSTNGLLLDFDDPILQYVEEIAIPLDGSCDEVNARYRGTGHFNAVNTLIQKYRVSNYHFRLKVGTVLTRENYNDLTNLIPIISDANVYWRVFFCKNKGFYNHINKDEILDRTEYVKKMNEIHSMIPPRINFMYDCCLEDGIGEKTTTIIAADGSILVSGDYGDDCIGNMLDLSPEEVLTLCAEKNHTIHNHVFYYDTII